MELLTIDNRMRSGELYRLLHPEPKDNEIEVKCNCRNKDKCPLPGKCTTKNVIYEADVSTTNSTRTYVGLTLNTFKTRYTAHKSTFTKRE